MTEIRHPSQVQSNPQYLHTYKIPQPPPSPTKFVPNPNEHKHQRYPTHLPPSGNNSSMTATFRSSAGNNFLKPDSHSDRIHRHPQTIYENHNQRSHHNLNPQINRLMSKPVYQPNRSNVPYDAQIHSNPQVVHDHHLKKPVSVPVGGNINLSHRVRQESHQHQHLSSNLHRQQDRINTMIGHRHHQKVGSMAVGKASGVNFHDNFNDYDHHVDYGAPRSNSRMEWIPFTRRYYDLEPQEVINVVYVPVQRIYEDYYTVEHVVDYEPVPYQETVIEYVDKERIDYKLSYQLIQKKIIHLPVNNTDEAQQYLKQQHKQLYMRQQQNIITSEPQKAPIDTNQHLHHVNQMSNFVTSNVPTYKFAVESQQQYVKTRYRDRAVHKDAENHSHHSSLAGLSEHSHSPIKKTQQNNTNGNSKLLVESDPAFIFNDQQA